MSSSFFYRKRMDAHLAKLEEHVPAKLFNELKSDYQCVYQEIRNEVVDEMEKRNRQADKALVEEGRIEGIRQMVKKLVGDEDYNDAFEQE